MYQIVLKELAKRAALGAATAVGNHLMSDALSRQPSAGTNSSSVVTAQDGTAYRCVVSLVPVVATTPATPPADQSQGLLPAAIAAAKEMLT